MQLAVASQGKGGNAMNYSIITEVMEINSPEMVLVHDDDFVGLDCASIDNRLCLQVLDLLLAEGFGINEQGLGGGFKFPGCNLLRVTVKEDGAKLSCGENKSQLGSRVFDNILLRVIDGTVQVEPDNLELPPKLDAIYLYLGVGTKVRSSR